MKRTGRHGVARPRHFLQHRCGKLGAVAQRLAGNDDRPGRRRAARVALVSRLHRGLIAQPTLRDDHGQQAEHNGEPDHHQRAGSHF